MKKQTLSLVFKQEDFEEAQETFIDYFEIDNPTGNAPEGVLYDGLEPTLWVEIVSGALPALIGLIGIWLKKRKEIKVEKIGKEKKKSIILTFQDEREAKEALRKLLDDE